MLTRMQSFKFLRSVKSGPKWKPVSIPQKNLQCYSPPKPPPPCIKMALLGANGSVGQIISFLIKQSPYIDTLALYDIDDCTGTAMDVSHIDTRCRIQAYTGSEQIAGALHNSNIVMICAGVGRAPGMSMYELFQYNAPVVKFLADCIAKTCPDAMICVLTNPINSMVPMISKLFRQYGCFYPERVFGVTSIDSMRASSIVTSDFLLDSYDPGCLLVPVIGGHSEETIIPVYSQAKPCLDLPTNEYHCLIAKVRNAARYVIDIKQFRQGPRLSVGLGAARFANNLARALRGETCIYDIAYINTANVESVPYFAVPFELGPCGVAQDFGLLCMDATLERPYLRNAVHYLKCDIHRGETYIRDFDPCTDCPPPPCGCPTPRTPRNPTMPFMG